MSSSEYKYIPLINVDDDEYEKTLVKKIKEYLPLYDPKKLKQYPTIDELEIFLNRLKRFYSEKDKPGVFYNSRTKEVLAQRGFISEDRVLNCERNVKYIKKIEKDFKIN